MNWKTILLVLADWIISLSILTPVCYLSTAVSSWFWMLMIIAIPVVFIINVIFMAISEEKEE